MIPRYDRARAVARAAGPPAPSIGERARGLFRRRRREREELEEELPQDPAAEALAERIVAAAENPAFIDRARREAEERRAEVAAELAAERARR